MHIRDLLLEDFNLLESPMTNVGLRRAKINKKDEFYTQYSDIADELQYYVKHFKNKIVYCNCDDAQYSNFFKYFVYNFNHLGLKRLISTGFVLGDHPSTKFEINEVKGDIENTDLDLDHLLKNPKNHAEILEGNGDFLSPECAQILDQSDIVVSNPPFSLFTKYVEQLYNHNKKFLIIGFHTGSSIAGVEQKIIDDDFRLGVNRHSLWYEIPAGYQSKGSGVRIDDQGRWYSRITTRWFTNLEHNKHTEPVELTQTYDPTIHQKFDNMDAINVRRVSEIPMDYAGPMAVPYSVMDKFTPTQFQFLGKAVKFSRKPRGKGLLLNGREAFARALIVNKHPLPPQSQQEPFSSVEELIRDANKPAPVIQEPEEPVDTPQNPVGKEGNESIIPTLINILGRKPDEVTPNNEHVWHINGVQLMAGIENGVWHVWHNGPKAFDAKYNKILKQINAAGFDTD